MSIEHKVLSSLTSHQRVSLLYPFTVLAFHVVMYGIGLILVVVECEIMKEQQSTAGVEDCGIQLRGFNILEATGSSGQNALCAINLLFSSYFVDAKYIQPKSSRKNNFISV